MRLLADVLPETDPFSFDIGLGMITSPAAAALYRNGMTLRIDAQGPNTASEVARCLSKRSGVGLAVSNPRPSSGRRKSLLPIFANLFIAPDPDKPLVNDVRHIEVVLTKDNVGTRAMLFVRADYKTRRSDLPIMLKCLGHKQVR
ncbi:hypothetical protein [Caenibius sp. WL]|uniref:hypothetical protein n=1 Tax=Caenibius sp. WL TaxID=2872646 RepID=UPI001C99D5A8|nr:hypothetical protein [Caenibius sp. WL]QZP07711.1 hypothetical protein K5X80_13805 [Caenibius sp. WL]